MPSFKEIGMLEEIVEGFRLSPQQKHLWSLQQAGRSMLYRTDCAVLLKGELDTLILKAAIQYVVGRYEILRTTFRCLSEMTIPWQVIDDSGELTIQNYDLSDLDPQEQAAKIEMLFR